MWKECGKLKRWLATRCCAAWVRKFCLKLRGEQCNLCWTFRGAACFPLALGIWGDFKYFVIFLIHGFGFGSNMGGVEGFSLGGGVGSSWSSCTIGGWETSSNLKAGTDILGIFWSWKFSFWVCGSSGGNGKIYKRGWDVLLCKMWAIWFIAFFVASP